MVADAGARILSYSDMVKLTQRTEDQLEAAKAATWKYRDINVAFAEGFVQGSPDVPGEGFHYLNPKRLDCKFDAGAPGDPAVCLLARPHSAAAGSRWNTPSPIPACRPMDRPRPALPVASTSGTTTNRCRSGR